MLTIFNIAGSDFPQAPVAPAGPTTIFAPTAAQISARTPSSNFSNTTVVSKLIVTSPMISEVRVTITATTGSALSFPNVYIGNLATSGNAWTMAGNQVELLFGGASGLVLGADAEQTSDWKTITPATGSNALNFVVAYNVNTKVSLIGSVATSVIYSLAASQTASNPGAGFTQLAASSVASLTKIETR